MPIYPDTRPIKPEQQSVFDSPMTAAIKTAMRWMGLDDPQSQILALMNPMETGPAGGLVGALQKRLQRVPNPIKAYHGSPHDFDQFSMEHIGKGEGAQAYGHGLYFAEAPEVAATYKRPGPWSHRIENTIDGVPVSRALAGAHDPVSRRALDALHRNTTVGSAIEYLQQDAGTEAAQQWLQNNAGRISDASASGRMYEVNIHATPDQLLDWDKPLSQQSEQVQQAIKSRWPMADALQWDTRDFYKAAPPDQRARELLDAGIPGIKYLDGGSRAAGDGTRNYVIWDDSLIEVLRKFGVAVPVIEALRREAQANNGQIERQKLDAVLQ